MFQRAEGPYVVVELFGEQVAQVYVRSAKRANRGKVLFRLEEIRLPANAQRIAEAILYTFETAGYAFDCHDGLRESWRSISFEILTDQ